MSHGSFGPEASSPWSRAAPSASSRSPTSTQPPSEPCSTRGRSAFRETKAVSFAFDDGDARRIERDWQRFPTGLPLDVVEAPYRDIGGGLLTYLRRITDDPDAVAVVVMPELVARGTDRLLHNQRALYLKRLLLFEPRVILTSVPFQLT